MNSKLSTSRWRYLDTGFSNGYENMAIDEAIFLSCQQGKSLPTIRFYGWAPPAISLGYFQKVEEAIDMEACAKRGIDVVRRLSGGRAVLHDQELTYSLICPEGIPPFTNNILETYKIISECLISALNNLHLHANWATFRNKHRSFAHLHKKSASCFSSPSWYEITIDGKKFCGSAQKRGGGVFLQHGSILLELDAEMLAEVLPSRKSKQEWLAEIYSTTTSINYHLSKKVGFYELQAMVFKSFEENLGITVKKGKLTDYECKLKDQLLEERYQSSEWNLNASSIHKSNASIGTQVVSDSL